MDPQPSGAQQSAGDIGISGQENATAFVNAAGAATVDQSRHHTIINYYYREEVAIAVDDDDTPPDDLPCPYRGLYHFGPDDAEYFFGREVFITALTEATQQRSFIPVLGASGSGKSSVVLAGLVPRLQQAGHWQFTHFRPGSDPFHALALALLPLYSPGLDATDQMAQARRLASYLKAGEVHLNDVIATIQRHYPSDRILLIADQFEELYTLNADDAIRQRFLDCLLTSLSTKTALGESSLVLVATLRADFLGNALAYRPFADVLQNGDIKIGAMNPEELTQVIEQPAQKLGVGFEDGLVSRILKDVSDEPGNLPLLEFALTELWKRRSGKRLSHSAYEEIGEVRGALARHADEKFKALSASEQAQVRRIFVQLVRPGQGTEDTRRRATKGELGSADWSLVKHLADARLVVTGLDPARQEQTVEVVHEALIRSWGQLRQWIDSDRDFRVWQDRLRGSMHQWEGAQRDEGALLRGAPLGEAEEMLQTRRADLSATEQDFIQHSLDLRDRQVQQEKRRLNVLRSLLVGTGVFAIAASMAGIVALFNARSAAQAKALALSDNSQALYNANNDRIDALIAAIKAGKAIKSVRFSSDEAKAQVQLALQEAVYGVSERNRIRGHDGSIQAVAFGPDGKQMATAGRDNTVRLWTANGEELRTFEGHEDAVWRVSFDPQGEFLASASRDGSARLWNIQDGSVATEVEHQGDVYSVSFSPDGETIASGGEDGTVKLWNREGRALPRLVGHQGPVYGVSFSSDGQTLASASGDGTVKLWRIDGEELRTLEGHRGAVQAVAFSPDGNELATAGEDGIIRLWSVGSGQLQGTLEGHTATVWDVAYSPDGSYLASAGLLNQVKLWQRSSGREIKSLKGHSDNGDVWSLSFNPDGTTLATAGRDATVKLWAIGQQEPVNVDEEILIIQGHQQPIEQAEFGQSEQNENIIASASWDGTVGLWTLTGDEKDIFAVSAGDDGYSDDVWDVSFDPSGLTLAATGRDAKIRLWSLEGDQSPKAFSGHEDGIEIVAFSPDGKTLASASWDKTAKLWDLSGNELAKLEGHEAVLESVAFNPNPSQSDRAIATASWDKTARLWDLNGNELAKLEGHKSPIESVHFSPDGQTVVTASWDSTAKLWDLDGTLIQTLEAHSGWVRDAVFSPDGQFIATAGSDRTVRLWKASDRGFELVKTLWVHNGPVNSASFSQDSRYIVSSDTSGQLIIGPASLDMDVDALLRKACASAKDYLTNGFDRQEGYDQLCKGID